MQAGLSKAGFLGVLDKENIPPRGMHQSPARRLSAAENVPTTSPLRRVSSSSFAGQGRVVGLGLVEGTLPDPTADEEGLIWPERGSTPDSAEVLTAPASPNLHSPQLLFSPEAGPSTILIATDATLRSPRSSALLDPGAAGQSGRRSSISHASHSSSGSASSFHSALSIRMDEPASTATSRNPSSNYWLDSPEKYSPEEKSLGLPRVERRPRSPGALRSILSSLLGNLLSLTSTSPSDQSGGSKRSLPARLLSLAYVVFSLLYLTSRLVMPYTPFSSPIDLIRRTPEASVAPAPAVPTQWSARPTGPDDQSALSALHHPYRFSKMHSKLQSDAHEGILPFVYRASITEGGGEVTACVYTNEAWLSELPEFVRRWNGPISAVVEVMHERGSEGFENVISTHKAVRR